MKGLKRFLLSSWMTKAARLLKEKEGLKNVRIVLDREACLKAMEEGLSPERAVEIRQLR